MLTLGNKVMIIVPHEDDEILLTGGIIRHCILKGIPLHIIIATNGDYNCTDFTKGQIRIKESLNALSLLGVSSKNISFLGYPDTGMDKNESFIYRLYHASDTCKVFPSTCSTHTYGLHGIADDYHFSITGKHALYNRLNFYTDLYHAIHSFLPDTVFVTSQFDMHGDHIGLFLFTRDVLLELKTQDCNYNPVLLEGLIHSPDGDLIWPTPNKSETSLNPFTSPPTLETSTLLKWDDRISIEVPSEMQHTNMSNNLKYQSLLQYTTALDPSEPEVISYLLSFVKKDEIFWRSLL